MFLFVKLLSICKSFVFSATAFYLVFCCSELMIQMRHYSRPDPGNCKIGEVQEQLDELKGIMVQNIGGFCKQLESTCFQEFFSRLFWVELV